MINRIKAWFSTRKETEKPPFFCSLLAVNNRFDAAMELWESGDKNEAFEQFQMIRNTLKDIEMSKW